MIQSIYFIILSYFVLGAFSFYFINRNKPKDKARESWKKYITYFIIIHIIYFSIVLHPVIFQIIAAIISIICLSELMRLFTNSNREKLIFFILSLFIFWIALIGFISYSFLDLDLVLYPFLILSIFDSFSQISGQIFGKRKIMPKISPNKTLEGLAGGLLIAFASSFFIGKYFNFSFLPNLILVLGILLFAFLGDIAASYYKRQFGVKDFSKLLPGHGGFLDRFDSFIAVGFWITVFNYFF